ncbi:MAG TPA: DUF167 domain-containing protein [Candidatus Eisenbacteria bacterium]|nr:DUF167 domain-containing protein [Candidatus Eisenbacteria bacterium]
MSAALRVRVQPGARLTGLVGWMADGTLKLKVSAAAEDGRANRAVVELLAAVLGVREQAVAVTRGNRSRSKTIEVQGLDERTLAARIDSALGASEAAQRSTRRQGGG